jgi:hypothetical protein
MMSDIRAPLTTRTNTSRWKRAVSPISSTGSQSRLIQDGGRLEEVVWEKDRADDRDQAHPEEEDAPDDGEAVALESTPGDLPLVEGLQLDLVVRDPLDFLDGRRRDLRLAAVIHS